MKQFKFNPIDIKSRNEYSLRFDKASWKYKDDEGNLTNGCDLNFFNQVVKDAIFKLVIENEVLQIFKVGFIDKDTKPVKEVLLNSSDIISINGSWNHCELCGSNEGIEIFVNDELIYEYEYGC